MIKVAIVNASPMALEGLRRIVFAMDGYGVIWMATNGVEAVEKCLTHRPDLLLMDLMMPQMDGVRATQRIMQQSPCAILIVTASVEKNTRSIFEAMGHGALDVISTPILVNPIQSSPTDSRLLAKIQTLSKLIPRSEIAEKLTVLGLKASRYNCPPLILMGASTGGPGALSTILSALPRQLKAAVVLVQHIDAQFSSGLVQWLDQQTPLSVRLAIAGERPQVGHVYIAATNHHLIMTEQQRFRYTPSPQNSLHRPSIDELFKSMARHWPQPGIGVLLTGMGRDGAAGLNQLRQSGWHTIAQNQKTCVVYGMPKVAYDTGAAVEILADVEIAAQLVQCVNRLKIA